MKPTRLTKKKDEKLRIVTLEFGLRTESVKRRQWQSEEETLAVAMLWRES